MSAPPSGQRIVWGALAGSAALTGLVVAVPEAPLAVRSATLHVALETLAGGAGLLAALLAYGRHRRSREVTDLLVCAAFLLFALSNWLLATVSTIVATEMVAHWGTWAATGGRFLGAVLFCSAALLPGRAVARPPPGWLVTAAACAVIAGVAGLTTLLHDALPVGVGPLDGTGPRPTALTAHPLLSAEQGVVFLLFLGAAAGFWHRGRQGDDTAVWFCAASLCAAFARLHFLLFPSLYADVVYSGDVLRVCFYGLVAVAAAREVVVYWERLAAASAHEERRRVARDLHDGLAQELAHVSTQGRALARRTEDETVASLAGAAQRALEEARRAIEALTRPIDEPLDVAVAATVEELVERMQCQIELEVVDPADVSPDRREHLVRIVREAVLNAARHSGASKISVTLHGGHGVLLQVHDDGAGFDAAQAARKPGSLGLASMRERARALGADFDVLSPTGGGTTVRVRLP